MNKLSEIELYQAICEEFKEFNPYFYDKPNDPRLITTNIVINSYTIILINGVCGCESWDITIYKSNNKNHYLQKPITNNKLLNCYDKSICKHFSYNDNYIICDVLDIDCKNEAINIIKEAFNKHNILP